MAELPRRIKPSNPPRSKPKLSNKAKGYTYHRRKVRAVMLARYPLCQRCGNHFSEHMHEIDRNPKNLAPDNILMLCAVCHRKEHGYQS